jgi:hypothetical protein
MKFLNPFSFIAPISQKFAKNPQIYNQFGMNGHNGLDFAIAEDTNLYAVIDGTVFKQGYDPQGYGNFIRTKNQEGIAIIYAHLHSVNVSEGDTIKAGDLLGKTGNTGFSTGPHLHLGLRFYNEQNTVNNYDNGYYGYENPLPYFSDYNVMKESQDIEHEIQKDADPVDNLQAPDIQNLPASEKPSSWAEEAYTFVVLNQLSNGERPHESIRREEFWLTLKRFADFLGKDSNASVETIDFSQLALDQKPSEWAESGYLWVRSMDVSNGARPKEFISREEVWTMLERFFKNEDNFSQNSQDIKPEKSASSWAEKSQKWVIAQKISNGTRPQDYISREEVWLMFERIYKAI